MFFFRWDIEGTFEMNVLSLSSPFRTNFEKSRNWFVIICIYISNIFNKIFYGYLFHWLWSMINTFCPSTMLWGRVDLKKTWNAFVGIAIPYILKAIILWISILFEIRRDIWNTFCPLIPLGGRILRNRFLNDTFKYKSKTRS